MQLHVYILIEKYHICILYICSSILSEKLDHLQMRSICNVLMKCNFSLSLLLDGDKSYGGCPTLDRCKVGGFHCGFLELQSIFMTCWETWLAEGPLKLLVDKTCWVCPLIAWNSRKYPQWLQTEFFTLNEIFIMFCIQVYHCWVLQFDHCILNKMMTIITRVR